MYVLALSFLIAWADEPPAVALVPFASEESMVRLDRSKAKRDFLSLAEQFESQQNGVSCGPTTAVIVLNAIRVDHSPEPKPTDPSSVPEPYAAAFPPGIDPFFHRYTQRAFFDEAFTSVKSRDAFYGTPGPDGQRDPGLQLRQLHEIFWAHGISSDIHVVDDTVPVDAIRQALRDDLATDGSYVVVNYFRPALGQTGGGHISPLGAYDKKSDSFLIMDVNPNGHTWVWVPTEALVAAMNTHDTVENRGFLILTEGTAP